MPVTFGVLGPVIAHGTDGAPLPLRGPRHRAVLARLVAARRRVVPVDRLVADLWEEPPADGMGAVRTFVAALRRALEPDRPPRAPARLLVTEGPGYALRAHPDTVDAWRFEAALADGPDDASPAARATRLDGALGWWRGPALSDLGGELWARAERDRLTGLRLHAVELLAEAHLAAGAPERAAADLDAHVTEHPGREEGWRLLALALYRAGRQGEALAAVRRARAALRDGLGLDPGPRLGRLEQEMLRQDPHLDPDRADPTDRLWESARASWDAEVRAGARARLESTAGLVRDLAFTGGGGLARSRDHRLAAVLAAERTGDPELTARVIGTHDVPAVWTSSDDPRQATELVSAARRTLDRLPPGREAARCRLLAAIAVESRGVPAAADTPPAVDAAHEAVRLARRLGDPALLAFALNGAYMQEFRTAGLSPARARIGAELLELARRHGMVRIEVLAHLVLLQSRCAVGDLPGAGRHAAAADGLAARWELPLVAVFTAWYRALRVACGGTAQQGRAAYREAATTLVGAGMPGVAAGLLPLALLGVDLLHHREPRFSGEEDWGPNAPWVTPLLRLAADDQDGAAAALASLPDPPGALLTEARWALVARAAELLGHPEAATRARRALLPAAGEWAGAASGMLTLGPVSDFLPPTGAAD
ncbi:BTAD domain-containing putative transcriptional regulator [Streptomyces bohaiensis]|uniref:AfsR/SARP family transcriptional regulator n=1 Tax=Streptomyces bohaiensis TaxID=1431344 RepID=UPI003B788673